MKYKLINKTTSEEHLCEKVTVDGFDYYVIDTGIGCKYGISKLNAVVEIEIGYDATLYKGIICSNNPNIDIPKVVDEVERLAHNHFAEERFNREQENPNGMKSPQSLIELYNKAFTPIYKAGYNKSQETHSFSEEDIIDFVKWLIKRLPPQYDCDTTTNYIPQVMINEEEQLWTKGHGSRTEFHTTKELLQLWKEQQPKIVYYE